jgi:predicted metal-dependent peptidase
MNTLSLMHQARSLMLLKPQTQFLGSNVMLLGLELDLTVTTAATDGKVIKFNPEFIKQLTKPQAIFLLAHEVMHCIFKHPWRRGNRDPQLWNEACDFVINDALIQMGLGEFITDGLHDEQYRGMSAERVYAMRLLDQDDEQSDDQPDDQSGDCQSGDQSGDQSDDQSDDQSGGSGVPTFDEAMKSGIGDVEDAPTDEPELEREWDRHIMVTTQQATDAGTMPGDVARSINNRNDSTVAWQDVLQDLLADIGTHTEQSWSKKNRRFDEYLPGNITQGLGHCVIGTDTSGSMDVKQLAKAVGETMEVCDLYGPSLTFIPCDRKINEEKIQHFDSGFYPDDASAFNLHGGGGTDPAPVFDWCADNAEPDVLIFFTDGYVNKWPEDPGYPVVWAFTSPLTRYNKAPDFGTVVEAWN